MLLDIKDPTKFCTAAKSPILEPEKSYENNGFKPGLFIPAAAVIIDDTLYVYYGGSDSYVCVATANLWRILKGTQAFAGGPSYCSYRQENILNNVFIQEKQQQSYPET